jgi:hypothetical protein
MKEAFNMMDNDVRIVNSFMEEVPQAIQGNVKRETANNIDRYSSTTLYKTIWAKVENELRNKLICFFRFAYLKGKR